MQGSWFRFSPWYLTITSTLVLAGLGYFLVTNLNWFKETAFASHSASELKDNTHYYFSMFNLYISMLKRSVAMFAGVGTLLIGLAVCFFTIEKSTSASIEGSGWAFQLATASPGIFAMFVGAMLIAFSVHSKDSFSFNTEQIASQNTEAVPTAKASTLAIDPCLSTPPPNGC
ncbi:hypothetical protein A1OO_06075 [Enterovibrio norvegicus FF-33]|uniref:hypothetical protein n=1 Tax=Enterovibrio TaxID=188143 RepID=UPI000303CE4D|nr:hypothetical protein [Enterovibrio norvegicus]OEE70331.1 hypothetical protein A1OO_06075 [Enterovibrio norvegicus FF-33]